MTELTSSELNPFQQDQNIQPQIQKADHPLSPEGTFWPPVLFSVVIYH
jgi:hypothetical protein